MFILGILDDAQRVRRFLNWFRTLRQEGGHIRWLLAGSIGLDTVAALHNLADTINDLSITHLGAFEHEVAIGFLEALDGHHKLGLDAATREHVVAKVAWPIPFFLQLVYRELRNLTEDEAREADIAAVDDAWSGLLVPGKRSYFDYWRQRLQEQLGRPRAGWAETMLTLVSTDPNGMRRELVSTALSTEIPDADERDTAVAFLLQVLENDGYLVEVDGRLQFRSPLLRDWWRRFHGQ